MIAWCHQWDDARFHTRQCAGTEMQIRSASADAQPPDCHAMGSGHWPVDSAIELISALDRGSLAQSIWFVHRSSGTAFGSGMVAPFGYVHTFPSHTEVFVSISL